MLVGYEKAKLEVGLRQKWRLEKRRWIDEGKEEKRHLARKGVEYRIEDMAQPMVQANVIKIESWAKTENPPAFCRGRLSSLPLSLVFSCLPYRPSIACSFTLFSQAQSTKWTLHLFSPVLIQWPRQAGHRQDRAAVATKASVRPRATFSCNWQKDKRHGIVMVLQRQSERNGETKKKSFLRWPMMVLGHKKEYKIKFTLWSHSYLKLGCVTLGALFIDSCFVLEWNDLSLFFSQLILPRPLSCQTSSNFKYLSTTIESLCTLTLLPWSTSESKYCHPVVDLLASFEAIEPIALKSFHYQQQGEKVMRVTKLCGIFSDEDDEQETWMYVV